LKKDNFDQVKFGLTTPCHILVTVIDNYPK
jgi:hypothetical protein